MTLEAGKEMDRRCVLGWLNEVYRHPTVAFNTYSDEQQIEFAHDALVLLKEHETTMQCIKGKCRICPHCANCDVDDNGLLKEQEAKPMTEYDDGWDCPRCGLKLVGKTASGYPCDEFDLPNDEIVKYCPVCGQAVKLE